ncbi:molybdenum cofactor biosynthesis protein B [Thiothrix eikelboomii]|uniref:molybdenum cofactor biosynthesis protein B n=1 Tax=Thiothrix eikelboomii TaxID=92487 RepID=UPI003BAF9090
MSTADFKPLVIAVLTISDTRTLANDSSGQVLVDKLTAAGHQCLERELVPDSKYAIRAVVSRWILDENIHVIISTGGTGVTGRDGTPEAVKPLLDKELEGFGEMFRVLSYQAIKTSTLQSRAIAGVANSTYLFCLPGSSDACHLAWDQLIEAQLDYRTQPCNLVMLMPRLNEV